VCPSIASAKRPPTEAPRWPPHVEGLDNLAFAERNFEGLIAADAGIKFRAVDQATRVVQGYSASGVWRLPLPSSMISLSTLPSPDKSILFPSGILLLPTQIYGAAL